MEKSKSGLAQYQWKKTRIENDILPFIGNKKIKDIKIQDVTNVLIEKNKTAPVTASKLFGYLKSIYSYAKTKGYIEVNLLSDINKTHIISSSQVISYPKITEKENAYADHIRTASRLTSGHSAEVDSYTLPIYIRTI